jgi:hypothetical protein
MTPDPAPWQEALATLPDPGVTAVLTVQCDLEWLRRGSAGLRDEIDNALAALAMTSRAVRIDRIMLHNLPAISDLPPSEVAELNRAHDDWIYRLAVVRTLLPDAARPRIHRLIVPGDRPSVVPVDGIELQVNGAWAHPDAAFAALGIVHRLGATTPVIGYDMDLDGPFGDTDPSVYL